MASRLSPSLLSAFPTTGFTTLNATYSAVRLDTTSCWLGKPPAISSDGRMVFDVDGVALKAIYQRVAAWVSGAPTSWGGELVAYDLALRETARYAFALGTLTGLTFPRLDAASKDAASLKAYLRTTGITPSSSRTIIAPTKSSVPWSSSLFQVALEGIDARYATRVDPIVFSGPGAIGGVRIQFDGRLAATLSAWFRKVVVEGGSDVASKRMASITYMSSAGVRICALGFRLGIYKLDGTMDGVSAVTASFYAEKPTLSL